jgi:hypothetical protein
MLLGPDGGVGMRSIIGASVIALAITQASIALAETPCDFKGVSVGDKATPAAVMTALGITKYKNNPPQRPFKEIAPTLDKYGINDAAEMEDWDTGPYCVQCACTIPYGVSVGNDNTLVKVVVGFNKGVVTEFDVLFNIIYWDELMPVINNKYGDNWQVKES